MENQTWVVGVDGSDNAAAACDWAVAHAAGRCRELRLVNVWQYPYVGALPMAGTGLTDASAGMAEGAQTLVQAAVDRLQVPEGVAVSGATGEGPAAEVLLDGAADADLLVVGTRGRGGFRRLVLGSVSHQTATHATAPTVVVPLSASARTASAVMGMDGSANAKAALAWLLDFAPEAAVTVVGTWDPGPVTVDHVGEASYQAIEGDMERVFVESVDEVLAAHPGREVTRRFGYGAPGPTVVRAAEEADLVVVGARGRSGVTGLVLGSCSNYVVHHAQVATVVVPAPATDADQPASA